MASSGLLNVKHQLTFYGAYHDHPINVAIHMIFVPVLLWTGLVLGARVPTPSFFPEVHTVINDYLAFDFNWSALWAIASLVYYYILEPTAALLYTPQMILTILTSAAFAHKSDSFNTALLIHVSSWVAQFAGHFLAEGRSPALLDNLVGALVLAPFFVHIEILFKLGYNPSLQKSIHASITEEISKLKSTKEKKGQ
ncbi:DUF962-domain-containing protein [Lentinus tigrinus ALCF2SS1-7]|uniref:DUF962-domain-containing protein n=1 Tax=Lentinus tigrinus ALCF2SS1-6 TaxID=1328759 RepID=A0A5C2SS35_9APHY|nr:DUF962-domain-containing protein [Lentinus tigrinus ALCF2SS1-6]RPD80604.1 DUF962-domain-containing protein [Lentinus tigrinus ALCF2SS1-7]